jgi:hypothetical protein
MSTSRKCPACSHWNTDADTCVLCGAPLSYELIRKAEIEKKEAEQALLPVNKFDQWVRDSKHSEHRWRRIFYFAFSSIWFLFFMIYTFIVGLIALAAG